MMVCPNCKGSKIGTWAAQPCGMCGGSGVVLGSDEHGEAVTAAPEAPGLDKKCPNCGVEVGEHTIREYGNCTHEQGLNYHLPHETIPGRPIDMTGDPDQIMVGSIDVISGTMNTALGEFPIVGFRFAMQGAEPMSIVQTPTYLLIGDVEMMQRVPKLVADAAQQSIYAVKK